MLIEKGKKYSGKNEKPGMGIIKNCQKQHAILLRM